MSLTDFDYQGNRIASSLICLIALVRCAFTGSVVAAIIAIAFSLDCALNRWLELTEHASQQTAHVERVEKV